MDEFIAFRFEMPDTPEYVVAKAGLCCGILSPDGEDIEVCDKLIRLFGKTPLPPLEEIVPALIAVGYVCNAELGGAIHVRKERMLAIERLKKIGLSDSRGAIFEILKASREATAVAAEDCRNMKPLSELSL
jgi:hypothetical protein